MTERSIEVGVVVAKRRLKGPWLSYAWLPHAVLAAAPDAAPWSRLGASDDEETFYAGAFEVELHRSDTGHYRDNLASEQPSLWISLRPVGVDEVEVGAVTADPYEGEAMAEGIGEIVEAVPMPPEVQQRLAGFVEAFHVERPFFKRKRDKADPNGRKRGGSGPRGPEEAE